MNIGGLVLVLMSIDDPMKTVHSILLTSLLAFLSSCTKESFDENIVGKWQIQEIYVPDDTGRDSYWTTIPEQYRTVIEFKNNGNFNETPPAGWTADYCAGTYTLIKKDKVQINSVCYTDPYSLSVNISEKELTIFEFTRAGEAKKKFVRIH